MPALKSERDEERTPEKLRPFIFHGVDLNWKSGDTEAIADCPFCEKTNKFSVNIDTGFYRCFYCGTGSDKGGGNIYTFINHLWETSIESTSDYGELQQDRGLLYEDTLIHWEVCQSISTHDWLVPGFNLEKKLCQLYRYIFINGKRRLIPTPTLGHQIHGMNLFDNKKPNLFICEGPWDALILWETMARTKEQEGKYVTTANQKICLLADTNIIAIPGTNSFNPNWANIAKGKNVYLLYDNDHPRTTAHGKTVEGAGIHGVKQVASILSATDSLSSLNYLQWGKESGVDLALPSGTDVRDILSPGTSLASRVTSLGTLLDKLDEVPEEWLTHDASVVSKGSSQTPGIAYINCDRYSEVRSAFRKAMKWTEGLDTGLVVMLSSIASTMALGDQLWVKIIGPASCGKSTLCEAVSVNTKYVMAKSTIRGFHSGFSHGDGDNNDHSLISKVAGKTLVTKDGDTLLQSPNLPQILSEARDVYDTVSRTSYRNSQSKDYQGIRMTWILCGTSSLRSIDASELGERFLDCVIMDGIDEDMEDEIIWRVVNRANRNLSLSAEEKLESQHDPNMLKAMQLTGGYVGYLRENASALLAACEISEENLRSCGRFGKFVAYMRARPSTRQDENAEREFAARLASQHVRLAKCVAVVLNKSEVDDEALAVARKVCLDTARGQVLEIVKHLYACKEDGADLQNISLSVGRDAAKTKTLLRFMRMIRILETVQKSKRGVKQQLCWRLTDYLRKLYEQVVLGG